MKTKMANFVFLQFFILLFCLPAVSFGADVLLRPENAGTSSRESRIRAELDCVASARRHDDSPNWEEVCASTGSKFYLVRRQEIVSQALDSVAQDRIETADIKGDDSQQVVTESEKADTPLHEQTPLEEKPGRASKAIQIKELSADIGFELYRYSYKEPVFDLEIEGLQYGVFGTYIYRPPEDDPLHLDVLNMYKIDARFAAGPIDYSSVSGEIDKEDNYVFEIRGVTGYDHFFNEQFLVTGYGGFGYRYLNNDSGGRQTTTGDWGYERVSQYFYLPIGVEAVNQISAYWKVVSNLEWDIFLTGKQSSYLSDVSSDYPDLDNTQRRGYGIRGSLRIVKEGESVNLFLEPFFRYWRIKDSEVSVAYGDDVALAGLEPDNNSTEYGFKLGLQF
jgi:hypothetical protein